MKLGNETKSIDTSSDLLLKRIEDLRLQIERRKEEIIKACDRMYAQSKNLLDLNNRFASRNKKDKIGYKENVMQEILDLVSSYRTHVARFLDVITKTSDSFHSSTSVLNAEEASQVVCDMISSLYVQLWIIYQYTFQNLHFVHRHFLTGERIGALSPHYESTTTPDIVLNLGDILRGGIVFDVDKSPIYLRLLLNMNKIRDFIKDNVLKGEKLDFQIEDLFDALICLVGWRNQIVHPGKEFRRRFATGQLLSVSELFVCLGLEIPRLLTSVSIFLKFLFKETEDVAVMKKLLKA